jgi:hypothetical protein
MTTWQLETDSMATAVGEPMSAAATDRNNGAEFWPHPPQTVEESGLSVPFIEDHLTRLLYFKQQMTGAELASECGLPYVAVQPLIHRLARDHFFEVVGQVARVDSGYRYALASKGHSRAAEALNYSWYDGPLPVPIDQYVASLKNQPGSDLLFRREDLRDAFSDLVVSDDYLDRIGPAINAGNSLFLYGSAGNGKTATADRITRMIGGALFIPRAIEVGGSIVMIYDQLNHELAEEPSGRRYDGRWIYIKRPVIVTGGELTLAVLDLIWNYAGKFYEAPLQMKANGGTFLIDDFGRQLVRPADLLNRWIVPLEKRVDYLTLRTGKKFEIPFKVLLLFSTNLNPTDLADEAFLRRLGFRVGVQDPNEAEFEQLFRMYCASFGVPFDRSAIDWLLATWWHPYNRPLRFVQPRDLIAQVVAIAQYLNREPAMEPELLDRACRNYFITDTRSGPTQARV